MLNWIAALSVVFLVACGTRAARADTFPNRTITIVVPFTAGSPTDVVARAFAADLSEDLGNAVIVENRPGANQVIAGSYVWRAKPDGYTLYFVNIPAIVPPSIQANLPYHGVSDFAGVSDVLKIGFMLVTAPNVPATNLKEFIAMLRADPSKYSFGSSGIATTIHLVAEIFNNTIGVKVTHVPYKGGNQVQLDLLSSRITYAFLPTGSMDYVRVGKLKGFAYAAAKRDPAYPELPTMEEAGLPNFKATVDFVLVAPKQTPADVIARLNGSANKILAGDKFYNQVKSLGGVQVSQPASPAQVKAYINSEEARWNDLVNTANIKLE